MRCFVAVFNAALRTAPRVPISSVDPSQSPPHCPSCALASAFRQTSSGQGHLGAWCCQRPRSAGRRAERFCRGTLGLPPPGPPLPHEGRFIRLFSRTATDLNIGRRAWRFPQFQPIAVIPPAHLDPLASPPPSSAGYLMTALLLVPAVENSL